MSGRRRFGTLATVVIAGVLAYLIVLLLSAGVGTDHRPRTVHVRILPTTTTSTASTTTTVTELAAPTTHAPRPRASRYATAPRPALAAGDIWAALANCETHMQNEVGHGTDGRGHPLTFYGFFQFTLGTWQSLGYSGNPMDHPYEVQREAAQRLVARSGWGQFPACSHKIGMR